MSEAKESEEPQASSKPQDEKVTSMKERLSQEISSVEKRLSDIAQVKNESISKIEAKKKELRQLSQMRDPNFVREEHARIIKEMVSAKTAIKQKKVSITLLDQTLEKLDSQIAEIQAEHDKAVGDLEIKKTRLQEQLEYYEKLNQQIAALVTLLNEEEEIFNQKQTDLQKQRAALLKRTDLSETTLKNMVQEIDGNIQQLNKEHDAIQAEIKIKLSDFNVDEATKQNLINELYEQRQSLTEQQIKELQQYESELAEKMETESMKKMRKMTMAERLALLRQGMQITPSGRIIMKGDRTISLSEAERIGLLKAYYGTAIEEEEEEEEEREELKPEEAYKGLFYETILSSRASSSSLSESTESTLSTADIEYLKRVFGKPLSLGLAEITAVQPFDPIHYLAHWLFKYRYNQEISEVKRQELQALMIERERLEAEAWHEALEEEARQAIIDALRRAELIALDHELARLALLQADTEFEGEDLEELPGILPLF